jgi:hypothetical protein
LLRKFKAQKSQVITLRWKEIERPKILQNRNKWIQSDGSIETNGVATHCYEQAPINFSCFQL